MGLASSHWRHPVRIEAINTVIVPSTQLIDTCLINAGHLPWLMDDMLVNAVTALAAQPILWVMPKRSLKFEHLTIILGLFSCKLCFWEHMLALQGILGKLKLLSCSQITCLRKCSIDFPKTYMSSHIKNHNIIKMNI